MPGFLPDSFTFTAPTQLLAVVPTAGPTTGGILVTLIGAEFRSGLTVTFAGVSATGITVLSPNTLTCLTPAHAAGAVDVVVTNASGLNPIATLTGGFTYAVAAPGVTVVTPAVGSESGGEEVIITGTGFVATPTVKFGGTSATSVTFLSSTQLACLTPAHAQAVVDVAVTNPDTQAGTLFGGFTFEAAALFADTGGWWTAPNTLAGGTTLATAPGVPKHPRQWAKLSPFTTLALGGSPAASVLFRNHMIYAGDDYTLGTTPPTIRIFDGIADRIMATIPNASGAVPRAILSMLLQDGIVYLSTVDSGTTSSNFAGRVFSFDPLSQTLTTLATGFSGGEVPYALTWHMDRLWVGTNKGDGTPGKVYFIRPGIDTTWTTDYTLTTSSTGGATSLLSFNGKLYVGTDNAAAAFGKVLVRDATGAYTTADTGSGGTARVNNGFYSMSAFLGNLYVTYWNNDGTAIAKVRKFDGTSWTTAFSGSALTLRPYILSFVAQGYLYVVGGGVGQRATVIRTADGATWSDLTLYLSGPITETALPLYGAMGI